MPRFVSLAAAAAMCLALAAPAQAQFPNPLRKAKEKAGRVLTGQQPAQAGQPPKFDNQTLELNPPTVNRIILGLQARAKYKSGDGQTAVTQRRRADEAWAEAEVLNKDRSNERNEFNARLGTAQDCRSEVHSGLKKQHDQERTRRFTSMVGPNLGGANSPNGRFMQDFQRIVTEMQQAMASQDTARIRKAEAEQNKLFGFDPKADSAKANAQCPLPTPPSWLARADALTEEGTRLHGQARELEEAGNADALQAASMTGAQFAAALERIQTFVTVEGTRGFGNFTRVEHAALSARLAELKALLT